jgi:hypothetical protein
MDFQVKSDKISVDDFYITFNITIDALKAQTIQAY